MRTLTVKETAAELRKHLKAVFPGFRFSVTMTRGTGHGWLNVRWNDGPTADEVNAITRLYQSEYFDGRDDGYHPTGNTITVADEEVYPNSRGINTHRNFTEAAYDYARERTGHTGDAAMGDVIEDGQGFHVAVVRYPSNETQALREWLHGYRLPF